MNIEEKLELVQSSNVIVSIKEGMFVRFYEQSLFGGGAAMGGDAVIFANAEGVKKLNNQEVVYTGLPLEWLRCKVVEEPIN